MASGEAGAVQSAKFDLDSKRRTADMREALKIAKDEVANLPLYHSVGAWALSKNIDAIYRADAVMEARFVNIK